MGFNVDNISLHIVPIELKYGKDENGENEIRDIIVHSSDEGIRTYNLRADRYAFNMYDRAARTAVRAEIHDPIITSGIIDKADDAVTTLFPELGIHAQAVSESAEEWVKKHSNSYPLEIIPKN